MDSLKSAFRRTTQTVMEKFGKAEGTIDTDYQDIYTQFNSTWKTSQGFSKHVGQLIENFHAMSINLHFLAEDFRDLYSHTADAQKKEASVLLMGIAEELENKAVLPFQNQVTTHILNPTNIYVERFPPAKDLHNQRKKLLLEYDYYRDKVKGLTEKQSKNPLELPKMKEKMNVAKDDYDRINDLTKSTMTDILSSKSEVYSPVVEQLIGNLIQYNERTSATMSKLKKFGREPLAGNVPSPVSPTLHSSTTVTAHQRELPARVQSMSLGGAKEAPIPPQFKCEWFYLDNNVEQQGPFDFIDMRKKFKSGVISDQTHVFGGELSDWKTVATVPNMKKELQA
ncbi:hypothetical protein AKO1_010280 [Acrasis kona]|uniref:BAR domain-containing protein n=1 Tax=Acrasis kona TaxID=1008807 RepID=A0AAW2ZNV3_9EUKA